MSDPYLPYEELDELAAPLCSNQISESEVARLESLLGDDEAARVYFVDHLQIDAELHWNNRLVLECHAAKELVLPDFDSPTDLSRQNGQANVGEDQIPHIRA